MKSTQLITGITDRLHQRRLGGWLKALQPRYDVSRRADEFVQCVVSFQRQKVTNSWFDAIVIVMVSDPRVTAFPKASMSSEYYQDFGLQMLKNISIASAQVTLSLYLDNQLVLYFPLLQDTTSTLNQST